ncbi:hypothetical protein MTR67_040445 [Solanum verrucosum]|uniref:DUF4283 domain-containing protein n=1 Tax=Solanum verrucosum TaxID=315347 RepID=A0AAF0ZRP4_SOLVR|nr:hypothetical protein MTR67_040445 [Solanum verrucosum]
MEFTWKELHTVPIWIKLPSLDFKYWSLKGLSKIGSLVGKPLMVDRNTKKKIGLNFARLLVEVVLDAQLPETILFRRNEKGNLIEQKVTKKKGPKPIPNDIPKEHEKVVLPNIQTYGNLTQANNTTQNNNKSAPAQPQTSVQSRQSPTYTPIQDIQTQPQAILWVTPSKTDERRSLWESFENHSLSNAKPWLALGDFNSVLKSKDRFGGNPVTWAEVIEFQNCIDRCGLIEMAHQGQKYTWNDKGVDQRFFLRIDWTFINNAWLYTIPTCKANYLPKGISDNCPIKVTFVEERLNTNKSFQFCNV